MPTVFFSCWLLRFKRVVPIITSSFSAVRLRYMQSADKKSVKTDTRFSSQNCRILFDSLTGVSSVLRCALVSMTDEWGGLMRVASGWSANLPSQ